MPGRSTPRFIRHLAGLALAGAVVLPATPTLAADPPIVATFGACDVFATGPVSTTLTLRIKNPNGTVRKTLTEVSDAFGHAHFQCSSTVVRGGDTLKVTASPAFTASLPIPRYRAAIDRDADTLALWGPKNTPITVTPLACGPGQVSCGFFDDMERTFNSNGRLSMDLTSIVDLTGRDAVMIERDTAKGVVQWQIPVPSLDVTVGAAKVAGIGTVGDPVLLRLRTSGRTLRGSATASPTTPNGRFAVFIRKPSGAKVSPALGDRVTADLAPDAKVVLVAIPVTIDATTFTFTCPANAPWSHQIVDGPRQLTSNGGVADATGEVTQPYVPGAAHGMTLVVRCGTAAGDAIRTTATIP